MLAVEKKAMQIQQAKPKAPENLSLAIRNLLLNEVTSDVIYKAPQVARLAQKIREETAIHTLHKREAFTHVAGVDAGSQIIPLAARQYAVIGALGYIFPSCERFFQEPVSINQPYNSMTSGFRGLVNIIRETRLFETATKLITEREVELLLIDGPLALSGWWRFSGGDEHRSRLIDSVNALLRTSRERGVIVAGVVKRPSARYYLNYLGYGAETDYPDAAILHHALKPGERTDIFSPRTGAGRMGNLMDALEAPIYSFYARMSRDWSIPPIRVDVPAFALGSLDDVADYCYASSFWEGIPLPIVKADEEVKVTHRFIGDVYAEIVSRLGREGLNISSVAPYWGEGGWMGV